MFDWDTKTETNQNESSSLSTLDIKQKLDSLSEKDLSSLRDYIDSKLPRILSKEDFKVDDVDLEYVFVDGKYYSVEIDVAEGDYSHVVSIDIRLNDEYTLREMIEEDAYALPLELGKVYQYDEGDDSYKDYKIDYIRKIDNETYMILFVPVN